MDTNQHFEIVPLIGTTTLRFGMLPSQVQAVIGVPEKISKNHLKQRVEFRSFMNVGYGPAQQEALCHIGFGRQMKNVFLNNINMFQADPQYVLRSIASLGHAPMLYLGFVVFLDLGIALTGFHDKDESQRAVSLFDQGAWENRREKMRLLEL